MSPTPPRTRPTARKPARKPKARPARKAEPGTSPNRSAREGWTAPHFFEGKMHPPVENPAAWYSIPEVVARLGVSLKTVKKLVSSGKVASKRHGYYRLVSKNDVDRLACK